MNKLSNTKIIVILTRLLSLILFAKLISLVMWWYFPDEGIDIKTKESYSMPYKKINFSNMLSNTKKSEFKNKHNNAYSINNLVLKGLYGNNLKGYAIVALKSVPTKTTIIGLGETYQSYTLQEIQFEKVIFTKNGNCYELSLDKQQQATFAASPIKAHIITKNDIKFYTKHPENIWKEIGLNEKMQNGKLMGFIVTKIKKGSKMANLGLHKGDLLVRVNNIELNSLKNVAKLYKNLNKLEVIDLVILRANQEMEINYEIN